MPGPAQEGAQHLEAQAGAQVGQALGSQLQVAGGRGQKVFDKMEAGVLVRRRHFDDLGPVAAQEQIGV